MGYILGLGDRHIQNILIDTSTAELVHIDLGMLDAFIQLMPKSCRFKKCYILKNEIVLNICSIGIAFEQGRILPTPETVPFRLTRDVIDGMGVSGVEGTFRR